jgi:hypothetical protein
MDKFGFIMDQLSELADGDYKKFNASMCMIFDVHRELIVKLAYHNYIDQPLNKNYKQWIILYNEINPIAELLAYLFTETDDAWNEPFIFTEDELALRKEHFEKVKKLGIDNYFKQCSINLGENENYINNNYSHYIKYIKKKILNT